MDYPEFFRRATGNEPFPYQQLFAVGKDLPDTVKAPTGAGKTATTILGWLWRRLHADQEIRKSTPTRLVYCLPMRVLVEQTRQNAHDWLVKLGLDGRVGLHTLMGGEEIEDWHLFPEKEAILIGTQDMLLSRALNRGYGISRYRWPMEFGLLNNDCLWIFDEVQLMGSGLATSTQLEAFRHRFGAIFPCKSIWMSATLKVEWLQTVDFKTRPREFEISDDDRRLPDLRRRLTAAKTLEECSALWSEPKAIARSILECHRSGSLTLVVMNTVDRAADVLRAVETALGLGKTSRAKVTRQPPELVLLHSRFRPPERAKKIAHLLDEVSEAGRIAVTTQVIEAGVDISAKTLFTELAPWPALVQRFGRCNRYGEHEEARVLWLDVLRIEEGSKGKSKKTEKLSQEQIEERRIKAARPYDASELVAAHEHLNTMMDVAPVSLESHLAALDEETEKSLYTYSPIHVVRAKDLLDLFDTTPDLADNDIDIARFIRDGEELDVQVFWREPGEVWGPEKETGPVRDELCSVPFHQLRDFVKKGKEVHRWDFLRGQWVAVRSQEEIFPGQTYLIPSYQGGYDNEYGWSPKAPGPVEVHERAGRAKPDSNDADEESKLRKWETIKSHTDKVVEILETITDRLAGMLGHEIEEALFVGARWHDRGKTHEEFREAIVGDDGHQGNDWAKAPQMKRYNRQGFRHELASALAMLQAGLPNLACYLAAAHHGKVRLSIRSLPTEGKPHDPNKRFARGIWDGDPLPLTDLGGGVKADEAILSLEPMELGLSPEGKPSWAERILNLRDDPNMGPFRLAFLEALLRAADIRASRDTEPEESEGGQSPCLS